MALIYVQKVHSSWSKKSRGGRGAQLRAKVPLALPLIGAEAHFCVVETKNYGEANEFRSLLSLRYERVKLSEVANTRLPFELLKWDGEQLCAQFVGDYWNMGAPGTKILDRYGNEKPSVFTLNVPLNRWIRLRWNGRFTDFDDGRWWYEHTAINIAYFESAPPCDLFTSTQPHDEFCRLAMLNYR